MLDATVLDDDSLNRLVGQLLSIVSRLSIYVSVTKATSRAVRGN